MSLLPSLEQELQAELRCRVRRDVPLRGLTSIRIGGPAAALAEVSDSDELVALLRFCKRHRIPWFCLGRGSNLLIDDGGFPGVVILAGRTFREVNFLVDSEHGSVAAGRRAVRAGAAVSLAKLVARCSEEGCSGLEFAGGIPGSVGGATVMNAGAFGGEMARVIRRVELVSADGRCTAEGEVLDFGYRSWPWFRRREREAVVTAVEFVLAKDLPEKIAARCRKQRDCRRRLQRVKQPNAGSFFKNPPGTSAGALIDACGLKGLRRGDALVSHEHANFFVNAGSATAAEMRELMEIVQQKVLAERGVLLEPEVRLIGGERST